MLNTVVTIVSAIAALFAALWAVYTFRFRPLYLRARLSVELELSAPLIHESANSNNSLTVRYGKGLRKTALKDPHIAQIRLSNVGRMAVRSSDFDQAAPVQLDVGVKIVGLLRVISSQEDMPDLTLSVTGNRLNIGPGLIPPHVAVRFILLVNGPCNVITPKNTLPGVDLIDEELVQRRESGIRPKAIIGYVATASLLFFVIKDPDGAAHLISNIGNFLSSIARGFSSFFTSL